MNINGKELDLSRCHIMGILNVTPDSFSDGGKWNDMDSVLRHTEEMIADGAAIIDIGGESTRPGYQRISGEEEIQRVVPYIEAVRRNFDIPISIDTYKAKVAEAAIQAGAGLVNDIWGLKADGHMAEVVARYGVCCCLMHNRSREEHPYQNVMEDILSDLRECLDIAERAGIAKEKILIDSGVGFGKTLEENLLVLKEQERLHELGCPLLLGTSRKSVIGLTLKLPVEERLEGTIATTVIGVMKGCSMIRVHDVKENYRAMKMTEAVLGCNGRNQERNGDGEK